MKMTTRMEKNVLTCILVSVLVLSGTALTMASHPMVRAQNGMVVC